jgi:hypothetical protein
MADGSLWTIPKSGFQRIDDFQKVEFPKICIRSIDPRDTVLSQDQGQMCIRDKISLHTNQAGQFGKILCKPLLLSDYAASRQG